jgi:TolB-like protein/Flp pilus assembly protein TadD
MSSIIEGYTYDIFISYRQNDNRSDWVTQFVAALQEELAATLKEPVSVYFDTNPHDGLLETHNVDKSLEGKLKCLIFIPIISQTYCDSKSFAWQHEFCAFNKMAKEDKFGRDIRLISGNIASRILPVKIHDLDPEDKSLFENELEGVLRSIEFIYKSAGVNRPLRVNEDHPQDNLNKTYYRDQVNKIANAIKEIIGGIKNPSSSISKQIHIDSSYTTKGNPEPFESIAVLPFANMSRDPEQEYFSDGISEEIINVLSQLPDLKVTGRTSSFTFKGKHEDLRSIGEKLGVRTILEGSVRSSGNRIRITAQLIDVQSGFHLWSEKYDRIINDVFEVQDEIATAIMEKLKITMAGKKVEPKHREQTQNVEAYQNYLKGRALVYKRGEYLFEAMTHFQMALEIDPMYALAYAGLSDAYTIICYYGLLEPAKTWPKAIETAKLAFKYGPDLAESYNCNAAISLLHDWNWELARMQFLKALELNSGYEQARIWYGLFFLQMAFGKHEEAILNIRLSLNANPLSFYSYTILGLSLGIAGQNEEGLEKAKRAFEMEPTSYMTQYFLADLYDWSGNFEESINMYNMALLHSNRHSWALSCLAITYAHWARKDKAEELYQELIEQSKLKYIQPATLSIAAAAIGKNEEALKFAHKACDEHDPFLIFSCRVHPYGKELRSIKGFDAIFKRMGLL